MAYIENRDEEEEEGQQAQEPLTMAASSAPAPAAPVASSASAPAQAQNAGQAPGRFVNFQRYFDANSDAAKATGNKLGASLEKGATDVQKGLGVLQRPFVSGTAAKQRYAADNPSAAPPALPGKLEQAPAAGLTALGAEQQQPVAGGTQKPKLSSAWGAPALAAPTETAPPPPVAPPARAPTGAELEADTHARAVPLQSYSGPESLRSASGWDQLVADAGRATDRINQANTAGGRQALLQEQGSGSGLSDGGSRFDSALVGAASGDRFRGLRDRFGGLQQSLTDADKASVATVGAEKARIGAENDAAEKAELERQGKAKGAYDVWKGEEAARLAAGAKAQAYRDAREGKESWWDYNHENQAEGTIQDIGSWLDPLGMLIKGISGTSPEEWINSKLDPKLGINSNKVRFQNMMPVLPGFSQEDQQRAYESLTSEELRALERMPDREQTDWLIHRMEDLKDDAKRAEHGWR